MKTKTIWTPSDLTNAEPVVSFPRLSVLEFQSNDGEWYNFQILQTPKRIVFGGACNVGFLESGFILREDGETLDETLQELLSDLECFYNDGPEYVSRIVVNERM